MHDDRTMVEARLDRVVREKLRPAVRSASVPLVVEAWEAPGEPVPVATAVAADYAPFTIGSPWGRPWGTTWFRMRGEVPAEWEGQRVEAVINLGFTNAPGFQSEGMLWRQAEGDPGAPYLPWRGLHPFNHDVAVADPAKGGEVVEYLVEAASNPNLTAHRPDPSSDVLTAGTNPIYTLSKAQLVVVERDVYELREDTRALSELMGQLRLEDPRRHEILRALERMLDVLVLDDVAGSAGAARAELTEVLSRPAVPSAHRISAIGHAHIDSAWLWPIRETKRKCARTFSNTLELMDDYPELKFACSSAAQYEWMRDEYPSIFERIGERVADGRWLPVGGMWVEPDVNLAGGEALVRQITYGQRFFDEHFGTRSTEVWIPDVFGYSAALPQLMRLGGIDRFLTQKLSWNKTNKFPHHTFIWEGIDGSSVFTHFPPIDSYNALFQPMQLNHAVRNFTDKGRAHRSLMPFGFGDGGGGPNRQMLQQFRRVHDLEGLPKLEIESPEAFFDKAIADYPDAPRWVGELYFETHRGTYTSQAKTKLGNRRCELLLREAELWCVAAYGATTDGGYPKAKLDRIWKTVLLHQFHDILPGSSIEWVHREAEETYAGLIDELEEIIAAALLQVQAQRIDSSGGDEAAPHDAGPLVANAAPHARDEVVLLPVALVGGLTAEADNPADVQRLTDGAVAFRAQVPAMGVGRLVPLGLDPTEIVTIDGADQAGHDTFVVRNAHLAITIDESGLLRSIRDLDADREVLAPGAAGNLLQLHPDFPTEYDAWDLDESYRRQVRDLTGVDSIEIVESGPVVARVRITRSFGASKVAQTLELRAGSRRLDVRNEIDWAERDHVLKVAFPLDIHTDHLTREIQFGHLSTAIHTNTSWDAARFEVCAHRWVAATEPGYGVALLNDAKYGHDATRTRVGDGGAGPGAGTAQTSTTVRLTLLKGAQYPDPHADLGHHTFTYSLLPFVGDLQAAGVIEEGYRLNLPVRGVAGRLTEAVSTAELRSAEGEVSTNAPVEATTPTPLDDRPLVVVSEHPGAVIEAIKAADDGSGDVVVRVYEAWGGRTPLRLRFAAAPSGITVVDLLEEPNHDVPVVDLVVEGAVVTGALRPFQIVTLRITP